MSFLVGIFVDQEFRVSPKVRHPDGSFMQYYIDGDGYPVQTVDGQYVHSYPLDEPGDYITFDKPPAALDPPRIDPAMGKATGTAR